MNYLAHLFLSFGHEKIMVGNFIADKVKGKQWADYEPDIRTGILLHRLIDSFTDTHPAVKSSKARIRERYHKFSGIVTDMYYDHYLAVAWNNYTDKPLLQFTRDAYKTLFSYYFVLPAKLRRILPWMAAGNWLYSYIDPDNIGLALRGLASRINYTESGIENGGFELKLYYEDFRRDFECFFPEVIIYSVEQLQRLMISQKQ